MTELADLDLDDGAELDAAPHSAKAITIRAGLVAGLAALKILGAAAVLVWLPFSGQVAGSRIHAGFIILQLVAFGGAGGALLFAHARDRRTANLGAALLCVASAFSTAHFRILAEGVPALAILARAFPDAFLPYFLALFVREFPQARTGFSERLLRVIVPLSGAVGIALFAANLLQAPHVLGRETSTVLYWQLIFGLILLVLPIAFAANREWTVEMRRRVRVFWVAFAACLGPPTLTILVSAIPGIGPRFTVWLLTTGWPIAAVEVLLALLPVTIAYAALVERILPVRVVARMAVQYLLARWTVTAAAVLPLALLVGQLYRRRGETVAQAFSESTWFLLVAVALAGGCVFWREDILAWLNRRFLRDSYDARDTLLELTTQIRRADGVDELVAHMTAGIERALRPDTVAVLLLNESRSHFVAPFGSAGPLSASATLVGLVASSALPVEVVLTGRKSPWRWLPQPERHWLVDSGACVLVPLGASTGEIVGLLAVGDRRSELPYSADDCRWLSAIAESAALTIEAQTYRSAHEPDRDGHERWRVGMALRNSGARQCPQCNEVSAPDLSTCPNCDAATTATEIPLVLLGKFQFQREVGRGGMGVVYRAVDLALDRIVAIKTLPGTSPEHAQSLRREARAMAVVAHPHLATIYGAESWRGRPMLICEFMDGGTLADRLAAGPLSLADALALGVRLAEALEALHSKGVLHRDIKPSNIGFSSAGVAKLLDFGLVHMLAPTITDAEMPLEISFLDRDPGMLSLSHGLIGTPLYACPEAMTGQAPSAMFDLWSLNVLLFEAITGAHPFRGQSVAETMNAIRFAGLPRLADARSGQRAHVATYFDRALAKDASRRPHSASAVAAELRQLLT